MLSDVKSEQLVIRCLLENSKLMNDVDNHFISETAQDFYTTLKELYYNDISFLDEHIISVGNKINKKINQELIDNIRTINYDIDSFEYYYDSLKKAKAKYNIEQKILKDTLIESSKKGDLNINKMIELRNAIDDNLEMIKGKTHLLITPTELMDSYEKNLLERQQGRNIYPTGDSYLDSHLALGAGPGLTTTIFAATGIGKSAWVLNLVNKQINKRIPCVYISPENSAIMTMDRLIAMRCRIPTSSLYPVNENNISQEVMDKFYKEKERLQKVKHFYFVEEPSLDIEDFENIIKEAKKRMGVDYLIVTIDLLSMLKEFGANIEAKKIEEAMNKVHIVIRRQNVHLFGVVQANRSADNEVPKVIDHLDRLRPKMNTIKNSHAYGERSRTVLGLFRKKHYADIYFPDDPETEIMDDILEVNILKQNQGPTTRLKYLYIPAQFSFFKYIEEEDNND